MKITTSLKQYWRRFYDYVRYDFKEMAFPSSLPNPPHLQRKRKKLTFQDHVYVWKTAIRLYAKSWKTNDIDLDNIDGDREPKKQEKEKAPPEPSMMEDLAVAAKAGSEHLKPALQKIYMTKASHYRDALKNFVLGYQEGLTDVLKSDKETSKSNTTPPPNDEKSQP